MHVTALHHGDHPESHEHPNTQPGMCTEEASADVDLSQGPYPSLHVCPVLIPHFAGTLPPYQSQDTVLLVYSFSKNCFPFGKKLHHPQ